MQEVGLPAWAVALGELAAREAETSSQRRRHRKSALEEPARDGGLAAQGRVALPVRGDRRRAMAEHHEAREVVAARPAEAHEDQPVGSVDRYPVALVAPWAGGVLERPRGAQTGLPDQI